MLAVLNEVAENRIIAPQVGAAHVTDQPMMAGMIYPCVYLPQPAFYGINPPENKRILL
ncbi:MAG: hypothetical protein R2875_06000 [Desulfobacterales bacterium]